jgi:TRAP-type C4-dicarboxylate transport system substrate-binding protein
MMLTVSLLLLLVLGVFSSAAHAKTLRLSPHEGKFLSNSSMFTLNATCTVQVSNQSNGKIKINVLKNNCTVNGRKYVSGQATSVTVRNNSSFSVSAEAGTEINLTNTGKEELEAVCST